MPEQDSNSKPVPLPRITEEDKIRFLSKVNTSEGQGPNGDCHAFMGARTKRGYGVFEFCKDGKSIASRANRVAYFLHHGEDPHPDLVCHSCDWPPCVRGEHLFKGNNAANMGDAASKGRMASGDLNGSRLYPERLVRGSTHGMSKTDEAAVAEIRRLASEGATTYALAEQFGLSRMNISRLLRGITWKHANGTIAASDLTRRGERHYSALLTTEQVREIREKRAATGCSYQSLADEYNMSLYAVYALCTGKSWKHVV